ncbi:MAG: AEC family transporter [Clostridia bacterium]|nr:AEC family transporter [Clostridia bacterium]
MDMMNVINQVGMLSITMLIGFLIVKTGYIDGQYKNAISKLIVNLILPCLIISSISEKELKLDLLKDLITVFFMAVFCIATMYAFGALVAKILKIPDYTARVHKIMSSCGNVIFIGYPILIAMYGEMGFFYAIIYWLLNDLFLWTIGILILSKKNDGEPFVKKLLNPNTISFAIAIIMFVFGLKLPPVIHSAVSGIGALTTSLSMLFIGMALADVDVKNIIKKWWVVVIAPIKLVILPIVFLLIFKYIGIRSILVGVVCLEAAMPVQTVTAIIAKEHEADFEYAAVGLFVTTILSIFTLPFICYLIKLWV